MSDLLTRIRESKMRPQSLPETWPPINDHLIDLLEASFPDTCPALVQGATPEETFRVVAIQQGRRDVLDLIRTKRRQQLDSRGGA